MLRYLLEKEFKQILRNRFMSKLIVILPLMTIVLFPYVTNQEVVGVRLAVVDHDHSPASGRLVQKAASAGYFRLSAVASVYAEALHSVEKGESDLILEIPQGFERDLYREGEARLMISANSVDGMRGGLGAQYLAAVVADFNRQLREYVGGGMAGVSVAGGIPSFGMQVRYRFNPALDYKVFMVPGLIVILLTLLGCSEYWIVTAASVGLFVMVFYLGQLLLFCGPFLSKVLHWLSRRCFGVFLVHHLAITLVMVPALANQSLTPIYWVGGLLLLTVGSFGISFLLDGLSRNIIKFLAERVSK